MNALAVGLLFFLPKQAAETNETKTRDKKSFERKDIRALFTNRPFIFILILTMLGFMVLESTFSFSTMHLVTTLGASEGIISWVAFFRVAPELIV